MNLFACKHKASDLGVEREHTVDVVDDDFERVVYHLRCHRCRALVEVEHTRLRNGVESFLRRAP